MNKKRRDIETGEASPEQAAAPAVREDAATLVKSGLVEHVPLDRIEDNPWKPRATEDQTALRDLADNIAQVGLLQSPVGRERPGGRVQLAFGHRRVAAIRLLVAEGRWAGPVPISVRPLTNAAMAILALAENRKRQDITSLEESRAWRKALNEIEGLTTVEEEKTP